MTLPKGVTLLLSDLEPVLALAEAAVAYGAFGDMEAADGLLVERVRAEVEAIKAQGVGNGPA